MRVIGAKSAIRGCKQPLAAEAMARTVRERSTTRHPRVETRGVRLPPQLLAVVTTLQGSSTQYTFLCLVNIELTTEIGTFRVRETEPTCGAPRL